MVTDQLQQRLEGEIKRLQTMISDKQTLEDGLITDLNRKLQEATSRCQRLEHTRNEAEKRLLYATLENERLNVSFGSYEWVEKSFCHIVTQTLAMVFLLLRNVTYIQWD